LLCGVSSVDFGMWVSLGLAKYGAINGEHQVRQRERCGHPPEPGTGEPFCLCLLVVFHGLGPKRWLVLEVQRVRAIGFWWLVDVVREWCPGFVQLVWLVPFRWLLDTVSERCLNLVRRMHHSN